MGIYQPARIGQYISGIVRSKLDFVGLLLGEAREWFDHQCKFFENAPHERRIRTPRELAAIDRLGELSARLEGLEATVKSILRDMGEIHAGLGAEDWVVVDGERTPQSDLPPPFCFGVSKKHEPVGT